MTPIDLGVHAHAAPAHGRRAPRAVDDDVQRERQARSPIHTHAGQK